MIRLSGCPRETVHSRVVRFDHVIVGVAQKPRFDEADDLAVVLEAPCFIEAHRPERGIPEVDLRQDEKTLRSQAS